ncbi:A-agglutinin-binding subunit [Monosporozyma unispora]
MQFLPILTSLFLMSTVYSADIIVTKCDSMPTNTLESTPYSTEIKTIFANHKSVVGVFEHYQSVEYTSVCGDVKPITSTIQDHTVPVF